MRSSYSIKGQQSIGLRHHSPLMYNQKLKRKSFYLVFFLTVLFMGGCSILSPKDKYRSATLLKSENATQTELIEQVNHLAAVNSMYAKMDLKLEDNSYADVGIAEKWKTADGLVVVQRPANIQLKVQIPFIKTDVAQMTSDGKKFRVAILEDGGSGKFKNFILGTNDADYSALQKAVVETLDDNGNQLRKNVSAFSNMRPQHFTEALLVRPIDLANYVYLQSTITQEEMELDKKNKKIVRWQLRGYYLLDEFRRNPDGTSIITRRFWFDRVGTVRLARQQIFDQLGEIESDILYGLEGDLTETGEYKKLPLQIIVTRPKEKYKMRLTYQSPQNVSIGKTYPQEAFVLENRWDLPEIDLDKKLLEMTEQKTPKTKKTTEVRNQ